ncbi:YkgJ family cysteine cluster protein [Geoalkalibacter halelectricus]|uniref:YkgJ family cysteine cluster protein n=1 Tax=Geoalkalibacter halelectricus TaxID=2847045 RepID=UPI003D21593C
MEPLSVEQQMPAMQSLNNYFDLRARVDQWCQKVEADFPTQVRCEKGCASCCRHLSLFWVEAVALALALEDLPENQAERLRERAAEATLDSPCPLLEEGACMLYAARPLICRTHGLPLLLENDGDSTVDFCEKNFTDLDALPAQAVLDLNLLNTTLAAINNLFISEVFQGRPPDQPRLSIAEALLLEL